MNEHPKSPARRWRCDRGTHALRASCSFAVLVLTSGCVTQKVWDWAGEGKYAFVPARVTSLGLLRQDDQPDRLFYRVDSPTAEEENAGSGTAGAAEDGREVYVVEVPRDWKERPTILVPDDVQPGLLQLSGLLQAKTTPMLAGAAAARLTPVPLQPAGSLPSLNAVSYTYVEGPPGILYLYGADHERDRWIRLSSAITGQVISTPAPKFNYAIAIAATPVTAAVDAVGVVFYAILWPLWASMDIGYGDGEEGYRTDRGYEPGRPRRELEKPLPKENPAPVAPPVPSKPADREEGP